MENKVNISEDELFKGAINIKNAIKQESLNKVLIVGIARGGLHLAQLLSYGLNCPVETISIQLRDSTKIRQDIYWEIYDFFNYHNDKYEYENLIFTDDLIDSGETIDLIKEVYNDFKGNNNCFFDVQFAVSFINKKYHAEFVSDFSKFKNILNIYYGTYKPKGWLIFPWDLI